MLCMRFSIYRKHIIQPHQKMIVVGFSLTVTDSKWILLYRCPRHLNHAHCLSTISNWTNQSLFAAWKVQILVCIYIFICYVGRLAFVFQDFHINYILLALLFVIWINIVCIDQMRNDSAMNKISFSLTSTVTSIFNFLIIKP